MYMKGCKDTFGYIAVFYLLCRTALKEAEARIPIGSVQDYFRFYLIGVAFIVGFGGLLAPVAEVKLGLGGAAHLGLDAVGY